MALLQLQQGPSRATCGMAMGRLTSVRALQLGSCRLRWLRRCLQLKRHGPRAASTGQSRDLGLPHRPRKPEFEFADGPRSPERDFQDQLTPVTAGARRRTPRRARRAAARPCVRRYRGEAPGLVAWGVRERADLIKEANVVCVCYFAFILW